MNAQLQPSNPLIDINDLIAEWEFYKKRETTANRNRLEIEKQILSHTELKPSGSTKIGALVIAPNVERKWDQDKLARISKDIDPEYWPFRMEWKEDRYISTAIEERLPDIWSKIKSALTINPRKATFSILNKE